MSGWGYAFAISKEEVRQAIPPGTVALIENHEKISPDVEELHSEETVRFPKPSSDPADPLNWALWRKAALLGVSSLYAFVSNFNSSVMAPGLQLWPKAFPHDPRPFSQLPYLIGTNVLFLGLSNILWVPLSNALGRRPVLLAATLLCTFCTMWCALATSFDSLLAARIFQGMGGGAAETVSPALIGEIFFVDERGRAMAVYTIFLCAGSLVGGVSGGYLAYQHGWAYPYWVSLALTGATFLGHLFLAPETLYTRDSASTDADLLKDPTKNSVAHQEHVQAAAPEHNQRPYTFTRSLGFIWPPGGVVRSFLQPWRTLRLPGTWVVMSHYGGLVGGVVTISTIAPQILAMPPYRWGSNVGLINVGALVGTVLGAAYTYAVSDAWLKRQAKHRRQGLAEAEDRLPLMFPALCVATCGFFVFGFTGPNAGAKGWVGLQVGFGMVSFGLMQVPSIGFNYLIDAYSFAAGDCFVMVTSLRAILAFTWTLVVGDWYADRGLAEPFGIFGMLMGIFSLLTVPLWLFGKRMRIATASVLE